MLLNIKLEIFHVYIRAEGQMDRTVRGPILLGKLVLQTEVVVFL
jgi:hypothetical protein